MEIIAEPKPSVNWQDQPDHYRQRALSTRARRQAAGRYARPSKAQQDAFKKSMQRGGRQLLTAEELGLLATMPTLTSAQRAEFATMAQAKIQTAVAG